ncbi:unnamed protein product, partial [Prorocentrum cordatum]
GSARSPLATATRPARTPRRIWWRGSTSTRPLRWPWRPTARPARSPSSHQDPFSSMEAFDDDELAATSADVSLAQRGFVVQKSKGPVTPEHGVLRADGIEDDEEALGLLDAFDLQA